MSIIDSVNEIQSWTAEDKFRLWSATFVKRTEAMSGRVAFLATGAADQTPQKLQIWK